VLVVHDSLNSQHVVEFAHDHTEVLAQTQAGAQPVPTSPRASRLTVITPVRGRTRSRRALSRSLVPRSAAAAHALRPSASASISSASMYTGEQSSSN